MDYFEVLAVACWAVAAYGIGSIVAMRLRMTHAAGLRRRRRHGALDMKT